MPCSKSLQPKKGKDLAPNAQQRLYSIRSYDVRLQEEECLIQMIWAIHNIYKGNENGVVSVGSVLRDGIVDH